MPSTFVPDDAWRGGIANLRTDMAERNMTINRLVTEAGANVIIAGSFVFENDVDKAVGELRRRCRGRA